MGDCAEILSINRERIGKRSAFAGKKRVLI
jgi:hypothetical protein